MAQRSGSIVAMNRSESKSSPTRRSMRNSITSTGSQLSFRPTDSDDPRMAATSQDNNKNRRASTIANKKWSATLTKINRNASLHLIDAPVIKNKGVARYSKFNGRTPSSSSLDVRIAGPPATSDSKKEKSRLHNTDTMDSRSTISRGMTRSRGVVKKDKPVYEIDHVGNETFQVSQLNLLSKRCLELVQTSDAKLSARGLHSRSLHYFEEEIRRTTNMINQSSLLGAVKTAAAHASHNINTTTATNNNSPSGTKHDKHNNDDNDNNADPTEQPNHTNNNNETVKKLSAAAARPDFHLYTTFFQRALAHERTGDLVRAMKDYSTVLTIFPDCAAAYFNRSGLMQAQGKLDLALADIERAIAIEPGNLAFRNNRSLLLRQTGDYMRAIEETITCRVAELQPILAKELVLGNKITMDATLLLKSIGEHSKRNVDHVEIAMQERLGKRLKSTGGGETARTLESIMSTIVSENLVDDPVIDFLSGINFFNKFSTDRRVLGRIAGVLQMRLLNVNEFLYQQYDRGFHFFIVVKGEIVASLGHMEVDLSNRFLRQKSIDNKGSYVFSKGMVFSEKIGRGAVRSPGAIATQPTTVLVLDVFEYQQIIVEHDKLLTEQMKVALQTCPVFSHWATEAMDELVTATRIRRFQPHETIIQAGELGNVLYVIKSGVVHVEKAINKYKLISSIGAATSGTGSVGNNNNNNNNNNNASNVNALGMTSPRGTNAAMLMTARGPGPGSGGLSTHASPQNSHHSGLSNISQGGGQGGGGSKRVSIVSALSTGPGASPSGHGLLPSPTTRQGPASSSPNPWPAAGKDSPAWGVSAPGQGPPLPGLWCLEKNWREVSNEDDEEEERKDNLFLRSMQSQSQSHQHLQTTNKGNNSSPNKHNTGVSSSATSNVPFSSSSSPQHPQPETTVLPWSMHATQAPSTIDDAPFPPRNTVRLLHKKQGITSSSSIHFQKKLGNLTEEDVSLGSLLPEDCQKGGYGSLSEPNDIIGMGKWQATVGVLSTGQMLGEACVLNPKMASTTTATAYTNVEVFCIDAEELLAHGIRYDSVSMHELNISHSLSNPSLEKVSYYFRSKLQWEKDKDRILGAMARENPLLREIVNRNK